MQQKVETRALQQRPAQRVTTHPPRPAVCTDHPSTDYDDGLLSTALPIMIAAYAAALLIAALTFIGTGEALLAIAICVVYAAMFFGVPLLMAKVRNAHDDRWRSNAAESTSDRIDVFGGTIRRHEALLQMTIVPLAVALAFAAFATIWVFLRP